MDKISVIIPVYNVEPYVRRCLDSVINQTYTNLEIICVDDGSTDKSGQICDEYAIMDKRVKVYHKENGGLSSALNAGVERCTGDFWGVTDSDDWLEPDMYEVLHKAIKENNVQISVASYYKDTDTESIAITNNKQLPNGIISTREMSLYPLKRDFYMGFCYYLCNKLFSAKIIGTDIEFNNSIKYGMDVLFYATTVLSKKCTGVYNDKPLYHYYQREGAITQSKSIEIKKDILKVYKSVEELLNSNGYSDISFWARGFYCHHAGIIAEIAISNNDIKTLKFAQKEIRQHLDDYIKTNREFPEKFERMYKMLGTELSL